MNCANLKQFPCNWANTRYSFKNQSQINAAMDAINRNCSLETMLENKLIIAQRDDAMYDIYLDLMRRWQAIGGNLAIGSLLVQPALTCPTGKSGYKRLLDYVTHKVI